MSTVWTSRRTRLIGGPLDGNAPLVFPVRRGCEPPVITLAYGATHDEPWPHEWLDYHRHPDGTYRWPVAQQEAS